MSLDLTRRITPVPIRRAARRAQREASALRNVAALLLSEVPRGAPVRVFYGRRIPGLDEESHGGIVKFQHMQALYPNSPRRFNVLYMVSSRPPDGAAAMAAAARRKGARVVWNQDGVAYPAWHGPGWEEANRPLAQALRLADHVFYQSEFCKLSADRYLGPPRGSWEVLHNPVDTELFAPASAPPPGLLILAAGTQTQWYRMRTSIEALSHVRRRRPEARLVVAGRLAWSTSEVHALHQANELAADRDARDAITYVGPYTQAQAPAIFNGAHVLLHTKYNDPCPSVVLEALACGVPVAYSASGGVPELVGREAGIGLPAPLDWERDIPPDPGALAEAILEVVDDRARYAEAARRRAVERFDLRRWLARHRQVFESLL